MILIGQFFAVESPGTVSGRAEKLCDEIGNMYILIY